MTEPRFDLGHHPPDMTVGADPDHLAVTGPGIAPLQDLDRYAANAPLIHLPTGRLVEVDGVSTRESKSVVIHLVDLTGCPDAEHGAAGPAGPISCRTVDVWSAAKRGTKSREVAIADVIALGVGVGGGSDLLDGSPRHRGLVAREGMGASSQSQKQAQENWNQEQQAWAPHRKVLSQKRVRKERFRPIRMTLFQNRHMDWLGMGIPLA